VASLQNHNHTEKKFLWEIYRNMENVGLFSIPTTTAAKRADHGNEIACARRNDSNIQAPIAHPRERDSAVPEDALVGRSNKSSSARARLFIVRRCCR
jgi:hypothetical protein